MLSKATILATRPRQSVEPMRKKRRYFFRLGWMLKDSPESFYYSKMSVCKIFHLIQDCCLSLFMMRNMLFFVKRTPRCVERFDRIYNKFLQKSVRQLLLKRWYGEENCKRLRKTKQAICLFQWGGTFWAFESFIAIINAFLWCLVHFHLSSLSFNRLLQMSPSWAISFWEIDSMINIFLLYISFDFLFPVIVLSAWF